MSATMIMNKQSGMQYINELFCQVFDFQIDHIPGTIQVNPE